MDEYNIGLTNKALALYMQQNYTKLLMELHQEKQKINKLLYSIKKVEKYSSVQHSICHSCYEYATNMNSTCCSLCYIRNCELCIKNKKLIYGGCDKCCKNICNGCVPDIHVYDSSDDDDDDYYICPNCSQDKLDDPFRIRYYV